MAYFRRNEMEETRQQPSVESRDEYTDDDGEYIESDYDDGFDDDSGEVETLSEEEINENRRNRFKLLSGISDVAAVIIGTAVILVLLALLMSMIGFVLNDADRNLALFQNRF